MSVHVTHKDVSSIVAADLARSIGLDLTCTQLNLPIHHQPQAMHDSMIVITGLLVQFVEDYSIPFPFGAIPYVHFL